MQFRWTWITIALLGTAHLGAAQAPDTMPRAYDVRGFYQDTEMRPWRATLLVADSTIDGVEATSVRYRSRLVDDKWLFDYVAVWSAAGMRARLVGDGRAGRSTCELSYAGGIIEGRADEVPLTPKPAPGVVIPDFALAGYVSTLRLEVNDTVRVSVVRCLPQFGAAGISVFPFVGVVRAAERTAAPGGIAVPTWEITGSGEYPAEVVIRRSDAVVMRVKTPQGAGGYSIESLVP